MNYFLFRLPNGKLLILPRDYTSNVDESYEILGFFKTLEDAIRERERILSEVAR